MKGRGGRGPVKGAPERLAVQGHHALTALGEAAHEGHKTRLELGRIEQPKHAREGVMAWDAVPEREDLFEEGMLGAPEPDHVGAGLAPTQHGAQADEQDLQKRVALGIPRAWILQVRENRRKLLHGSTFDPKWCHRVESCSPPLSSQFPQMQFPWPPLSLAGLRAQNQLLEIDSAAPRFDLEETRQFIEHEGLGPLAPVELSLLHERTQGWPAALRIVASTFSRSGQTFGQYVRQLSGTTRAIS